MKSPRDVSADRVIGAPGAPRLRGDTPEGEPRQRHAGPPVHAITVPLHNPLKTGTLHGILAEVAEKRLIAIDSITGLL